MKESDTSCEFAIDIKNAPGVRDLINAGSVKLFNTQLVCQLLLPTFLDGDVSFSNSNMPDGKQTSYPNGEEISNNIYVGCVGKSSEHCPHPDSPHKVSQREEYDRLRSQTFKDYQPHDPNKY